MKENEIIDKLRNDDEYYGGLGRDYLSASDISGILDGTYSKTPVREWKQVFEMGKYFHVQTLEPEKLGNFIVKDVPRRKKGEEFLKQSEVEIVKAMKLSHDRNIEARGILYGPEVEYEVPAITTIEGIPFKGKADIINESIGYLGDLKSTSNLYNFDSSIEKWYCAQLWVYWKLFGKPTVYIVVDKTTLETQVIYPSKHFYALGKALVLKAIDIYKSEYV